MSKNIIVTGVKPKDDFDSRLVEKDKTLIVGTKDKSMGVVEDGSYTSLIPEANVSNKGWVKFNTSHKPLIQQWGEINITGNSTEIYDFNIPFDNSCFTVYLTHKENDTIDTMKAIPKTLATFEVSITGGIEGENISWFAIGH